MWTFEILKRTKTDENTIEIVVKFDNGTNNFQRIFSATRDNLTRSWLDRQIKREVEIFENSKSFVTTIKTGVYTLTPDPVSDSAEKIQYRANLRTYEQMKRAVDLGIINANNAQFVALGNTLKANFDPSFVDLF
jgi:hypothetical protein